MKTLTLIGAALFSGLAAFGAISAVQGTVTKVDSTARTIVVKTAEGTEHILRFAGKTVVHGTEAGAKDAFQGLKEGSEVVAHYTVKGTTKTAVEVDKVGKEGFKSVEGTVVKLDKGTKTLVVKAADGTEQAFHTTDEAVVGASKDVASGTEKSAKVTVYYTEEAGKKVAHFFTRR